MNRAVMIGHNNGKGGVTVENKEQMQNTEKENKLLKLIRDLKFGEVHIFVADGQPVRAEEIKRSVKF